MNVTVNHGEEIGIIHEQVFANYRSAGGDSGSPIVIGNVLVGAHVGKACVFSLENIDVFGSNLCSFNADRSTNTTNGIPTFTPWNNIRSELNLP